VLPCTASAEGLSGAYVGVSGGFATINTGNQVQQLANDLVAAGFTSALVTMDQKSANYKVFAGYNINKNFSIEAFYSSLGKYNFTVGTTGPVINGAGDVTLKAYGADVLAKLPIAENSSVYARVGYFQLKADANFSVGAASASSSTTTSNAKFGIGADYGMTENISLRTDWEYYNDKDTPVNVFSLGLVANF